MTVDFFNNLTPAESERLAMLAEEAAEVIQIIGKILRHGYDSYHPDRPHVSNRQLLFQELADFAAVQNQIHAQDRVWIYNSIDINSAWKKKLKYSHHQLEEAP